MFFLVKTDRSLIPYHDTLENLSAEQAAEAVEALECTSYIVQELTWVPAGKETKVKVPGGGKQILCVVESAAGELSVEETDPAEPREDGVKLYPVNKRFVRQYVPVKVSLEQPEPSAKEPPAKKTAPAAKGAKRKGAE